jgi:hypothetical protein
MVKKEVKKHLNQPQKWQEHVCPKKFACVMFGIDENDETN